MWFQSMDEPEIAFPVMHPNEIKPDYAPSVSDEMLTPLGDLTEDNTYILVTLTAAADKKDTTVKRIHTNQSANANRDQSKHAFEI